MKALDSFKILNPPNFLQTVLWVVMMMPIPQVGWVTSIMLYSLMITPALHGSIFSLIKNEVLSTFQKFYN